jgi:hypothetical protein
MTPLLWWQSAYSWNESTNQIKFFLFKNPIYKDMKKKNILQPFIDLAHLLFEMELQTISNDPEFHWAFYEWHEKFGANSIMFENKFRIKQKDVKELAKIIKADFDSGEQEPHKEGGLYNYDMPTVYGGLIVDKLEIQLADMTGVGTQLEMFA